LVTPVWMNFVAGLRSSSRAWNGYSSWKTLESIPTREHPERAVRSAAWKYDARLLKCIISTK